MKLRYTGHAPEADVNALASGWFEELFALDDKVVYLDADLMRGLRISGLWEEYPDRVFNCGIQEANMVCVAAGMYLAGYKPYVHSFSPFVTRRVYDQLAVSVAYGQKSVHVIGTDAGILASDNGGTHMSFEDVALIRVLPEATIVDVTDAAMFHAMLLATKDIPGVVYFRTGRRNMPDVYENGTLFNVGEGKVLKDGQDITIIASGIMVATALEAEAMLAAEGISVRVADPVTIKPLDKELILKCARETGAIVTAENANVLGGLGGAVTETVCENYPVPVLRMGVEDQLGQTGSVDYLRKVYGLTAENLVDKVHMALRMKEKR